MAFQGLAKPLLRGDGGRLPPDALDERGPGRGASGPSCGPSPLRRLRPVSSRLAFPVIRPCSLRTPGFVGPKPVCKRIGGGGAPVERVPSATGTT